MGALDILDGLDAGRPASERLHRLRSRIRALEGVYANLLSELCALDGTGLDQLLRMATGPVPGLATSPRGLDFLCAFVEGLRAGTVRVRVAPLTEGAELLGSRLERGATESLRRKVKDNLSLGDDEWPPEAEHAFKTLLERRRNRQVAERPLVLLPLRAGADASGASQVLAALVVNRQLRAAGEERARDLQARREAVLSARL